MAWTRSSVTCWGASDDELAHGAVGGLPLAVGLNATL